MVDRLVHSEANKLRIEAVEKCFGTSGIRLLIPGRVLVGEGILTKSCRKKLKKRQFFLFNDIIVYGNIIINKKKYNKQHIIPLEGVTLEDLQDDDRLEKNGWLIKTPHKSFAVYAATPTEKQEWMAHINKCIDELLKKTGKTPSSSHAAVWVPDAESKVCMHCSKTQFTLVNRRHHCRHCGLVICGNCSKNKFLIQSQSCKPVRVCDTCFNDLCQRRVSNVASDSNAARIVSSANVTNSPVTQQQQASGVVIEHTYDSPVCYARREGQNGGPANGTASVEEQPVYAHPRPSIDATETSDSEDDEYNESSDTIADSVARTLTLEDHKPTFYSEVTCVAQANEEDSASSSSKSTTAQ